jgi:hypothetical protein
LAQALAQAVFPVIEEYYSQALEVGQKVMQVRLVMH